MANKLTVFSIVLLLSPIGFAADRPAAEQAAEIVARGGKHWSAPTEWGDIAGPKPGAHVYLWPVEDRVYALRKANGKYTAFVALQWVRAPDTEIPKSKARNVRTHIFFHGWADSKGLVFGNTRSIIAAKTNTGTFSFSVVAAEPWEGERELHFRVMTNDRPGLPVANFLRLNLRTEE